MGRSWIQIDLECPPEMAEELAADLAERLGNAVEVLEQGVRCFVDSDEWSPALIEQVREMVGNRFGIGGQVFAAGLRTARIDHEDWSVEWKRHFKPLRVGHHFVVVPSWESYRPSSTDRVIEIDPGQAFGTGHHETTRLCLEWLESYAGRPKDDRRQNRFLDVGTGSGILSIAAGLLSFDRIAAIDTDPVAITVARENAAINLMGSKIHWACCAVDAITGSYQVVMANIQALPLIRMAGDLRPRIAADGRLVLSGILLEQEGRVKDAFLSQELVFRSRAQAGEWCLLEFSAAPGTEPS